MDLLSLRNHVSQFLQEISYGSVSLENTNTWEIQNNALQMREVPSGEEKSVFLYWPSRHRGFFPANRKASLTGGDVERPRGPHHGNVQPRQGHQLTEVPSKESEHQTGDRNGWILSSFMSSGLRFIVKQHGAGSIHLPNLGSVKLSSTLILKVLSTSEGPFVGYQTFTESVSAQGRGK